MICTDFAMSYDTCLQHWFVSSFAAMVMDGATSEQFIPLDHRFTTAFDPSSLY
jgi:hypothetical protein